MLRFQGGPLSGVPFSCFPTSALSRFDASQWARPTLANSYVGQPLELLWAHFASSTLASSTKVLSVLFYFGQFLLWPISFIAITIVNFLVFLIVFCFHEVGPRRVWGPKFRFWFPSPAHIFALFVSLRVSSRGILVAAAPKPPGFQRQNESPTCTFQAPARETQKERNGDGRRKKNAKFWAVRRRGPLFWAPTLRGPEGCLFFHAIFPSCCSISTKRKLKD